MNTQPFGHIAVTQFIRPHGRQEALQAPIYSKATLDKAREVLARGGRFTAEVLPGGLVSLCAEWKGDDIAIELPKNDGSGSIDEAFERVIERAWEKSR